MPEYEITWRAARVNAGYTLKEISELTGKCIDTIHRYEKDSSEIPLDLMTKLLEFYKVPEMIIFCGVESDLIGTRRSVRKSA